MLQYSDKWQKTLKTPEEGSGTCLERGFLVG